MTNDYLVWHMNAKYVVLLTEVWGLIVGVDLDMEKSRVRAMCCSGLSRRKCYSTTLMTLVRAISKVAVSLHIRHERR